MHDAVDMSDLFWHEVAQRRESGYRVDAVVAAAEGTDFADRAAAGVLLDALADVPRAPDWPYEEPNDLDEILPIPSSAESLPAAAVENRIHAGWLGRIAGCNLGKPVELGTHWTPAHLTAHKRRRVGARREPRRRRLRRHCPHQTAPRQAPGPPLRPQGSLRDRSRDGPAARP